MGFWKVLKLKEKFLKEYNGFFYEEIAKDSLFKF